MFSLCLSWRFADGPCSLSCLYIQGNWRDQVLAWIYTLPGTVFFWWILMANSYSSIQLSDQVSSLQEATSCSPSSLGRFPLFSLLPHFLHFYHAWDPLWKGLSSSLEWERQSFALSVFIPIVQHNHVDSKCLIMWVAFCQFQRHSSLPM